MRLAKLTGFSAGPILSVLIGLATVPAVAWLFPPAAIGMLDFFVTSFTLAGLLLSLGLDKTFLHEYHYSADKSGLLKVCMLPALVVAPLAVILLVLFAVPVSQLLFDDHQPALVLLFAAGMVSALINRLIGQVFRMQERAWIFSFGQVLPKLALLMMLPVLWFDAQRNFLHLAMTVVAASWMVTLWLSWHARQALAHAWAAPLDRALFRRLLLQAVPLLVSGIFYLAITSAGMALLRFFADFEAMGVYALAMRVAAGAWVIQSIFTIIWVPQVHKWGASGGDMSNIAALCRHAQAVVVIGVCLTGMLSWLIGLILPARYGSVAYLAVAAVGQPLLYALSEVSATGVNLVRRPSAVIIAFGAGLLCMIASGAWLVARCGATGAVAAQSLGFCVFFLARTELAMRLWRPFPRTHLYLGVTLLTLLSVGYAFVAGALGALGPLAWGLLLVAAAWVYFPSLQQVALLLKRTAR
jgi:O-antigen/teichoic acid export membrane protein